MKRLAAFLAALACASVMVLVGASVAAAAPASGTASCVGQDVSALATTSGADFGAAASGLAQTGALGQVARAEAQIHTNCPG
jgi:hypothetical protein